MCSVWLFGANLTLCVKLHFLFFDLHSISSGGIQTDVCRKKKMFPEDCFHERCACNCKLTHLLLMRSPLSASKPQTRFSYRIPASCVGLFSPHPSRIFFYMSTCFTEGVSVTLCIPLHRFRIIFLCPVGVSASCSTVCAYLPVAPAFTFLFPHLFMRLWVGVCVSGKLPRSPFC
jgi:hypothetical protein